MATITAAAGGGNWSAGATWVGGVAPTASDDAVLGASSGNVTIDTNVACRSLDCTGYTGTLTHNAAATLSIGTSTPGTSNIALKLVAGMTYTTNNASTSILQFVSTSATQQTVDMGGKSFASMVFNGAGGSWLLSSALTSAQSSSNSLTLTAGSLDTNGQTITTGLFVSNNSNTRSLTLGSSTINLSSNGGVGWNFATTTGLTFNAGTSNINFLNTNSTFDGGGLTYYNATMKPNGASGITVNGANTFNNLTLDTGNSQEVVIKLGANMVVNGTLTTQSTGSTVNPLMLASSTPGTARTLTAAVGSFANTDWQDITAAGAAAPFAGTRMGDAGGNSNITFDATRTLYWVGVTGGNWSSTASWSTSSGGSSGAAVPLPQDNVVFDANSITTTGRTITVNMRLGKNVDFSGLTNNPTVSFASTNGNNRVFGNITFGGSMTVSGTVTLSLEGRGSQTITTNGISLTCPVTLNAPGGTYTIQDALTTTNNFTLIWGTFASNNFTLTCSTFVASSTTGVKTFNGGTSTINLTSTASGNIVNVTGTNTTMNASSTTWVIANASANSRTFTGGSLTYGNLTYNVAGSTGALVISNSNSFNNVTFQDASNTRTLTLAASSTTTIRGTLTASGASGRLITINSSTGGTRANISKSSSVTSLDYVSIQDSNATGNAAWYAGANSTNVSNNVGWAFYAQPAGFGNMMQAIS
jgi:hypothetical protein